MRVSVWGGAGWGEVAFEYLFQQSVKRFGHRESRILNTTFGRFISDIFDDDIWYHSGLDAAEV